MRAARAFRAFRLAAVSVLLALAAAPATALAQEAEAADTAAPPKKPTPKRRWQDLKLPPLREYVPPGPERVVLPNGLVLFLLEDHELPVIDLVAWVRAGEVHETREEAGLASICGAVMRTGGIEKRTGDELDEELEGLAAAVEVGIALDHATASLSCMAEDFDRVLPIFVEVLRRPAFRQEKIDLEKQQHISAIARRNDDPSGIASREFRRALYGDDSPYGWTEEVPTIEAVTRDALVAFHQRYFAADRAVVGVVGDFDAKAMRKKIEAALGDWEKAKEPLPPAPAVAKERAPKAYLVDKGDVNQSTIVLGHLGYQRRPDDADHFVAIVANGVLGGSGFASRLMQKVRTEMGLSYGTYSIVDAPYTYRGSFRLVCQTKCETTARATRAVIAELEKICSEPVTEEELRVVKESILQSMVFENDSRGEVISRAIRFEYYGFPQDYLERLQAGVARVTAADVLRVAKDRFKPAELTALVVGARAQFDEDPAKLFGRAVQTIDVEEPAFGKAHGPVHHATAADKERGRELVKKAIDALGGLDALAAVRAIQFKGKVTLKMGPNEMVMDMSQLVQYPNKMRQEISGPAGQITQVFDGEKGYAVTPFGAQELKPSQAKELSSELENGDIPLLLKAARGVIEPAAAGQADVGGKAAAVVRLGDHKLFLDPATGTLLRKETSGAQGAIAIEYADWQPAGGIQVARKLKQETGGQSVELSIDEVLVNPDVPADAFAKPEKKPAGASGGKMK